MKHLNNISGKNLASCEQTNNYFLCLQIINNLYISQRKLQICCKDSIEANLLDRIKMTKNRLEFDRKKLTTMNLNIGT